MERMRKPFQGVWNIIRFNWHFFVASIGIILLILFFSNYFFYQYASYINIICLLALGSILISLLVSYYVYDLSNLYELNWLDELVFIENGKILNINAGFDETSNLLKDKFENSELIAMDFYDSSKHTEVSIKRARKAYPPFPNTKQIATNSIPLNNMSVDKIFLILSAHEIRDNLERTEFFKELYRILKTNGQIVVTEHLRDIPNFLAYNIGSFHFHSENTWKENIQNANFQITKELKITPFITSFLLEKNGNSS